MIGRVLAFCVAPLGAPLTLLAARYPLKYALGSEFLLVRALYSEHFLAYVAPASYLSALPIILLLFTKRRAYRNWSIREYLIMGAASGLSLWLFLRGLIAVKEGKFAAIWEGKPDLVLLIASLFALCGMNCAAIFWLFLKLLSRRRV